MGRLRLGTAEVRMAVALDGMAVQRAQRLGQGPLANLPLPDRLLALELSQPAAGHTVILGPLRPRHGAPAIYQVGRWRSAVALSRRATVEVLDFDPMLMAIILDGSTLYLPADVTTPGPRWVEIPEARELYASIPPAERDAHRRDWQRRLTGVAGHTARELQGYAAPVLRILVAQNAPRLFPTRRETRARAGWDGYVTSGVTRPLLVRPAREPACYIPVIASAEGSMEAINAYDFNGISLSSIQFNVVRGLYIRFLQRLQEGDPALFNTTFGAGQGLPAGARRLGWRIAAHNGHPDLVVPLGNGMHSLHALDQRAAQRESARYLHRGDPRRPGFLLPWRLLMAERFRDVVAWPHVQRWLSDTMDEYLAPGVRVLRAAGLPPLGPRPDRASFVLGALLMSVYVKASGCAGLLARRLIRHRTIAAKLAAIEREAGALEMANARCRASGVLERVRRQRRPAETVYRRLTSWPPVQGGTAPAGPARGTP